MSQSVFCSVCKAGETSSRLTLPRPAAPPAAIKPPRRRVCRRAHTRTMLNVSMKANTHRHTWHTATGSFLVKCLQQRATSPSLGPPCQEAPRSRAALSQVEQEEAETEYGKERVKKSWRDQRPLSELYTEVFGKTDPIYTIRAEL